MSIYFLRVPTTIGGKNEIRVRKDIFLNIHHSLAFFHVDIKDSRKILSASFAHH